MITIVCGTNRKDSISLKICERYQTILTELGVQSTILDLSLLPVDFVFSALYENSGKNDSFRRFVNAINDSQKLVFVVPEYNGSLPGVLKAFIDGLDYPHSFKNKKCALVGLSSGIQGGSMALSHLTDIFHNCGMNVLANKPKLGKIEANIDESSAINNPKYLELLARQARLLLEF